ncbi:hypothetical protein SALBM311S_06810 [Streptomyces alboniger]
MGLAGSVTTISAIAQNLPEYDSEAIHHSRVSRDRVREITDWLLRSTHAERASVPSMHPGRVDVIGAELSSSSRSWNGRARRRSW